MALDFKKLSPSEFEELCFKYTQKVYGKENYSLEHTRYNHDGGKDIEILFYDELTHLKVWAECKHHERNIGLEDIGKNVVLVIANQVNRIMFFSSSDIRESAQITISKIGRAFNFDVSYLYGFKLMQELQQYPDLVKAYFHESIVMSFPQKEINVNFALTEQESDILFPLNLEAGTIVLKKGRIINLYIMFSNYTNKRFDLVDVQINNCPSEILFINPISDCIQLYPRTDSQVEIVGEIINRQNPIIDSIELSVRWRELGSDKISNSFYLLPRIDITSCKNYPLIGKSVNEFLANGVANAINFAEHNHPQILSIYGNSGVGKSRLAEEIETKTREKGYNYIWLNAIDFDGFDLLRFLFYNLLKLPIGSGKISFNKKDVYNLIIQKAGSGSFAKILADFLVDGVWHKKDLIYFVDAFVYFISHPLQQKKLCVILDNLQNGNHIIFQFLSHAINTLCNISGTAIFVLVTNIERVPSLNQASLYNFLKYLDDKNKEGKITHFKCLPLSEEDRILFLIQLLHVSSKDKRLLNNFLEKVGVTPFEIIMMLEYLGENNIIEWTSNENWHIKNLERFTQFLKQCPMPSVSILSSRLEYKNQSLSALKKKKYKEIISSILCFRGFIPYNYLSEYILDDDLLEELRKTLWIVDAPSGKGVRFYHDNIYRFFAEKNEYLRNAPVITKILKWLNQYPDYEVDKRDKIIFYALYHLGRMEEARQQGLALMKSFYEKKEFSDGAEIGETLFNDEGIENNILFYIHVGCLYAENLFELDNKDKAGQIYRELKPLIINHYQKLDKLFVLQSLHRAINTQLQTAHYTDALDFVKFLRSAVGENLTYKFLAENREGVTQLCLGEFKKAEFHFLKSLTIATEMNDDFWFSTTQSDMALLYFYDWTIQDYELRSKKVLESFQEAIKYHYKSGIQDDQREIEMAWHKIFVEILMKRYSEAISLATLAMEKSEADNNLYGYMRALNLQGVAYILNQDIPKAIETLEHGIHICEMDCFSSGLFRMHNNLGVVYYLADKIEMALMEFNLAKSVEEAADIEVKQQPVLANLLYLYDLLKKNTELRKTLDQCNELQAQALLKYRSTLNKHETFHFTFWTFKNLSYIF